MIVVTTTPVVRWGLSAIAAPWSEVSGGTLIVLGGGTMDNEGFPPGGLPAGDVYLRALHAIYVWRQAHFRALLLSGAGMEEALKPLLVASGIPAEAIVAEKRSTNTRENALFSKPLLAELRPPYVLLTSDYHTYRATRAFAKQGIAVTAVPAPDIYKRFNSPTQRWSCFLDLMVETVKIGWYYSRSWI